MNVFEDLIEELRDENLLEETVIDLSRKSGPTGVEANARPTFEGGVDRETDPARGRFAEPPPRSSVETERDFYRKRAMDEVSSLQMVEHVLSGIEREHMKVVPVSYDDLEAKKALHRFLQVQSDSTSTEYTEAEFQLMHETEAWSSALSERDAKINVSSLRRFCENSRPVLSSQALMALGRFYRNAPFSELSRAKFDLVMTRLFSRETGDEKRRLLFGRAEMIGHIKTLYANWASGAFFAGTDISSKSTAVVNGFEDRVAEITDASSFQELVNNAFFKRIHQYKEASGELFFAPDILASAIDCNVRVGNKFVDLIRLERERTNTETVEHKYGYEYDQIISEAAGKTLHLVELLKSLPEPEDRSQELATKGPERSSHSTHAPLEKKASFFSREMFRVNTWLLIATVVALMMTTGLYFWANQTQPEATGSETAADVSLVGTPLKDYLRDGRATDESFYAITLPSWDQLSEDQKKETLRQALEFANKNGKKNVQLLNVRGRAVAFGSKTRLELLNPGT